LVGGIVRVHKTRRARPAHAPQADRTPARGYAPLCRQHAREPNAIKRDEIAARKLHALKQYYAGKLRRYFRRGKKRGALPGEVGSDEFMAAYAAYMAEKTPEVDKPAHADSLAKLIEDYYGGRMFTGRKASTQKLYRYALGTRQRLAYALLLCTGPDRLGREGRNRRTPPLASRVIHLPSRRLVPAVPESVRALSFPKRSSIPQLPHRFARLTLQSFPTGREDRRWQYCNSCKIVSLLPRTWRGS
jgi:hypothetical protein